LVDFGLSVDREGVMSLEETTFDNMLQNNPSILEEFFNGKTTITEARITGRKIGYQSNTVNVINADGSISTSTSKISIADDVTIEAGSMKINGVNIEKITLLATNTPAQNTQIVLQAINAREFDTGVKASVGPDGESIVLTEAYGGSITVEGDDDARTYLGFGNSYGSGRTDYTPGVFNNVASYFEGLNKGETSTLGLLSANLTKTLETLNEEQEKTLKRLDTKYETMAAQFASYSSLISQFENSFKSVQMQIDAMNSNNN
jgi:flagellar hook-associated protein 2